jgi:hypothetical protein
MHGQDIEFVLVCGIILISFLILCGIAEGIAELKRKRRK